MPRRQQISDPGQFANATRRRLPSCATPPCVSQYVAFGMIFAKQIKRRADLGRSRIAAGGTSRRLLQDLDRSCDSLAARDLLRPGPTERDVSQLLLAIHENKNRT